MTITGGILPGQLKRWIIACACSVAALSAQPVAAVENGPAPTLASTRTNGPYAFTKITVANSGTPSTFGGVTIWYPTSTTQTFGAVAVVPGFLVGRDSFGLDFHGPRLASHGFVVISVDPNSIFDNPQTRGQVLLAALDWLVNSSSVKSRVDPSRLAVIGHSMGGGGVLEAVTARKTLKAGYAIEPWNGTKSFNTPVPVAIVGGESDTNASPAEHAEPIYASLPGEKAYLELNNWKHDIPTDNSPTAATFMLSWIKRWVDGDTRYTQFLCPGPVADNSIVEEYRSTCPY